MEYLEEDRQRLPKGEKKLTTKSSIIHWAPYKDQRNPIPLSHSRQTLCQPQLPFLLPLVIWSWQSPVDSWIILDTFHPTVKDIHSFALIYFFIHPSVCWLTHPPAIHSRYNGNVPSIDLRVSRMKSLAVNLIAFSGDTPTNWGRRPLNYTK